MTTPLRQPRRMSRDPAPPSATRRTPSQSRIPMGRSNSQSGIPMANSMSAANRQASTQPTYDFLAGGASGNTPPKVLRTTLRQSSVKPDIGNEDLRAQIKTLQYEVESYKQDKEVARLRHEKELRETQTKAESDFKRAQASDSSKSVTTHKYDVLARELKELQDASKNKQHDLEKRLRATQEQARSLKEEVDEAQSEMASIDRQHQHRLKEVESKQSSLEQTLGDVQHDLDRKSADLHRVQSQLTQKESDVGELESNILKLRAQTGDADELATVKRELTEQVTHMRKLERTNREQMAELRRLRDDHRAVGIVEEEKHALELKVERMDELEREVGEAKFQRQILEDEKRSWATFLQAQAGEDMQPEYDTPEAVAKALAEERMERASLAERLGAVQSEFAEKEQLIEGLESEKNELRSQLQKAKTSSASSSSGSIDRARTRSERQKALAIKEAEYLRAQLKTFEQDATQDLEAVRPTIDEQTRARTAELEDLVARYRAELDAAAAELSATPPTPSQPALAEPKGTKRSRATDDDPSSPDAAAEDSQLGALSRKNRKLSGELAETQQRGLLLAKELAAAKTQVSSLQETARTRVLSLRSNPTEDFERAKLSTVRTLRRENEGLHALLERQRAGAAGGERAGGRSTRGSSRAKGTAGEDDAADEDVVPRASLEAKEHELEEERAKVREREKRMLRLKQTWAAKSTELRSAVANILGWNLVPTATGKFKLASIFNPGDEEEDSGGIGSNHLIFDPEKGEMLVNGGPNGEFGRELKSLIKFWVEGRKEIPGMMAACTLEFYERTTRAQRM